MLMPKTAVHEYCEPNSTYRNIRPPRKVRSVDSVAYLGGGKGVAKSALRGRVPAPNTPHVFASPNRADIVHIAGFSSNRTAFEERDSSQILGAKSDSCPAGISAAMWKFPGREGCRNPVSHWLSSVGGRRVSLSSSNDGGAGCRRRQIESVVAVVT